MTDQERVDEALRRAAEMLAEKMCERCHQLQGEHGTAEFVYLHSCYHFEGGDLAGWAEAIQALALQWELTGSDAVRKTRTDAIRRFYDTMLRGDHE